MTLLLTWLSWACDMTTLLMFFTIPLAVDDTFFSFMLPLPDALSDDYSWIWFRDVLRPLLEALL